MYRTYIKFGNDTLGIEISVLKQIRGIIQSLLTTLSYSKYIFCLHDTGMHVVLLGLVGLNNSF